MYRGKGKIVAASCGPDFNSRRNKLACEAEFLPTIGEWNDRTRFPSWTGGSLSTEALLSIIAFYARLYCYALFWKNGIRNWMVGVQRKNRRYMCFAMVGKSVGSKWNFYESSLNRLDLTFHRDIMYSTLYVYWSAYYAGTIYDWFDDCNARLGFSIMIMYFSLQKSARQNSHNEFCAMFEKEKKEEGRKRISLLRCDYDDPSIARATSSTISKAKLEELSWYPTLLHLNFLYLPWNS